MCGENSQKSFNVETIIFFLTFCNNRKGFRVSMFQCYSLPLKH